ncbi:hypothetical protein FE257_006086 [Aspergillus nanangensis]|uniref:D-lactate dehydrogenase (cytochrome) n=1 Tax=Aspergillus nanangensis TaxID=2582783 RepID=A0AAD4CRE7_ASPNN|nr:hypothetical protein FE257_006086 [Aspergillus nanangensis]
MGVPGDMNLELLDYIDDVEGLSWIGNANELNAAYAADGYSRVKGCPGVVVTTMGVGELSALNGVAGAFTEHVKLIHIVGTTPTVLQNKRAMIHHCLGPNPDHRVYAKISEHVRTAHCWLDNVSTAPSEIDRVLRECYLNSLPVYIFVPMDFVHQPVSVELLDLPVDLEPETDFSACNSAVQDVLARLQAARKPVIIVDALVARFQASSVVCQLLDRLNIPTFCTPMGKSVPDESKPYFYGVYNGAISYPGIAVAIEQQSDCILDLGPYLSDSNTGGHSRNIHTDRYISVGSDHVTVGYRRYENTHIKNFLNCLYKTIPTHPSPQGLWLQLPTPESPLGSDSNRITQSWIWKRIGAMARPNDIVIGESGTALFGLSDASFPSGALYLAQIYFGSIGWSVGACLGAAQAQAESGGPGRTILVVGDGSLQLTVQEIGTMIKCGLRNVILIVINNGGYTIERAIHGATQAYNDIASWDHQLLLSAFGHKNGQQYSHRAATTAEFEDVMLSPPVVEPSSVQLVEVLMEKMDVPWRLQAQIDLIKERNKGYATQQHSHEPSRLKPWAWVALGAGLAGLALTSLQVTQSKSENGPQYADKATMLMGIQKISKVLGEESVTFDEDDILTHGYSEWSTSNCAARPMAVVTPRSTEEVSIIAKICSEYKIPMIPFAGGSSVEGNFTAPFSGLSIDFSQMNKIIAFHEEDMDVVVQPGVNWVDLNNSIRESGLFLPMDPSPTALIGGMVATNCSGTNATRYGTMKDWVINLTVVLADGSVIKTRQRPRKTSAGYNLNSLFTGSEGTLGMITEITVRLATIPESHSVAITTFPSIREAAASASKIMRKGIPVAAVELMDEIQMKVINKNGGAGGRLWPEKVTLFFKFSGTTQSIDDDIARVQKITANHGGSDFEFAGSETEMQNLWAARKEALWAMLAQRPEGTQIWSTDVAVPLSRLADIIDLSRKQAEKLGLFSSILGHVGDGNFHQAVMYNPNDPIQKQAVQDCVSLMVHRAVEMEGTVSGEHGIGLGKKSCLLEELGPETIGVMRALKRSLDPHSLLNPGKVFDY